MRIFASVLACVLTVSSALGCCAGDYNPQPNEFFSGTRYWARATALSSNEFLVGQVFRGDVPSGATVTLRHDSEREVITVTTGADCGPRIVNGQEYLIAGGGEDPPRYIPWPPPAVFFAFVDGRHLISSNDLLGRLAEWSANRLPSDEFLGWLGNADTKTRLYREYGSLLVKALNHTEFLVQAAFAAESCNPDLEYSLRVPVAKSLSRIIEILPDADVGPPQERDIDDPVRDRYNPALDRLQDWEDPLHEGETYQAIRECWNRQVQLGGDRRPHRLLPP